MEVGAITLNGRVVGSVDITIGDLPLAAASFNDSDVSDNGRALSRGVQPGSPIFRPGIAPRGHQQSGPTFRPGIAPHGHDEHAEPHSRPHERGPTFRPGIGPGSSGAHVAGRPGRPFAQGSPATDKAIADAARAYGLDPNTMRGIASIESGMNPNSNYNRGTQYKGLYQIGRDEWAQYGAGGNS